jgi:outer membrane immunogenic protein
VAIFNNGLLGSGVGATTFNDFRNRLDWFGTVRGRLGYAIDRLLIYATGGGVFTDNNNNCNNNGFGCGFGFGTGIPSGAALVGTGFYNNAAAPGASAAGNLVIPTNTFGFFTDNRNNNWGWTVGGGVEYAFTNNLTAKLEGLYIQFDRNRNDFNNGFIGGAVVGVSNTGAPVTANQLGFGFDNRRNSLDLGLVRVGLNYKFGSY